MPKYFEGDRPLPFETLRITPEQITEQQLANIFADRESATICVTFNGFDESCLGYVFNIRKTNAQFQVLNITMEVELTATSAGRLADVIHHVSGIRFVEEVHTAFQNSRNNIGASMTHVY